MPMAGVYKINMTFTRSFLHEHIQLNIMIMKTFYPRKNGKKVLKKDEK